METTLPTATQSENERLNELAQSYVKLVLAVGMHDPFYVDAYYGPELWRKECQLVSLSLLDLDAKRLLCELDGVALVNVDAKLVSRHTFLRTQLASVGYFIRHLQGKRGSFDVESIGLYDAQANKFSLEYFDSSLVEMDGLLPGKGSLAERFEAFRACFIVPQNRVPQVFEAAVEKARVLTGVHIRLPENESFSIEFVNDKIWTAYNWYQGNYQSLIQLNQDQPLYIERCLELASHEGYPGHHVFNLLQEQDLVRGARWIEYAIYPLYSPISFLSEGSANYGLRLIMSEDEVVEFERDSLMPLAGIDGDIEHYHRVLTCYKKLAYLDNLVCEQLTDGHISVSDAECLLINYGLYSESRARQRVKFYLSNRAYVINYNHGEESVARWVERGGNATAVERWKRFEALLRRPLSASQFTT
ncbi:hypothetical protein [Shewanella atlantica]|uniref:DUF885 domain-containing protein n=1 Tax=Shewanella atlantica TaxID=271099 RepID=A0A3S0I6W8_9GAMM|nr:hypothetical protein [Shewanella atlantica]RTR28869.1 hypothetical protein EKG39_17980 [Shewanella atlantica]